MAIFYRLSHRDDQSQRDSSYPRINSWLSHRESYWFILTLSLAKIDKTVTLCWIGRWRILLVLVCHVNSELRGISILAERGVSCDARRIYGNNLDNQESRPIGPYKNYYKSPLGFLLSLASQDIMITHAITRMNQIDSLSHQRDNHVFLQCAMPSQERLRLFFNSFGSLLLLKTLKKKENGNWEGRFKLVKSPLLLLLWGERRFWIKFMGYFMLKKINLPTLLLVK
jgi:hypothetical protein